MVNEHNLKEGDRVTLAGDTNAIGTIRYVGKKTCIVDFGMGDSAVGYKDIEPLDHRTAFLTRLQLLLREFDAAIDQEYSSYSEVGIVSIIIGSECVVESYDTITADNIMDFDKEGV